ncbi:pyrroline-5-carboxylate reductase family protein [Nocardia sp. CA-128927]|uniref:pyrroline-5-carboxylate reductase family protein n=1 Tax=Nocardia sp. CA-128927 TaxID=3239975 RepID=UPI003D950CDB
METRSVGIIGLGRMGSTLAAGFSRAVEPDCLFASGRSEAGMARVHEAVPSITIVPLAELPTRARLIVLCVRNADLPMVLGDIRPQLTDQHVLVTINNGLPLLELATQLPPDLAEQLVTQSVNAASRLLTQGACLDEIIDRVAVPGGNTAAAVAVSRDDLTAAWRAAFQAAADNERRKPLPAL